MKSAAKAEIQSESKKLNELIDEFIEVQSENHGFLETKEIGDLIESGELYQQLFESDFFIRKLLRESLDQRIRKRVRQEKGTDGHTLFASVGITDDDGTTFTAYKPNTKTKAQEKKQLIGYWVAYSLRGKAEAEYQNRLLLDTTGEQMELPWDERGYFTD